MTCIYLLWGFLKLKESAPYKLYPTISPVINRNEAFLNHVVTHHSNLCQKVHFCISFNSIFVWQKSRSCPILTKESAPYKLYPTISPVINRNDAFLNHVVTHHSNLCQKVHFCISFNFIFVWQKSRSCPILTTYFFIGSSAGLMYKKIINGFIRLNDQLIPVNPHYGLMA